MLRCRAVLCCAALCCGAGHQAAAIYGRLEVCVRLVEAGSPWPSGKGSKSGGGDVVALLTGSKLCKQRQLKVRGCVNTQEVASWGYTQECRGNFHGYEQSPVHGRACWATGPGFAPPRLCCGAARPSSLFMLNVCW